MHRPLSDKLRPRSLNEVVGQSHLLGKNGFFHKVISSGIPLSILLYGPPGSGKTTLARIYGNSFSHRFVSLSAVSATSSDIRKIIEEGEKAPLFNFPCLLFLDEIHRFNKAKQDIFLPLLEDGKIVLIGATTENPSFSLNNALLSRMRTFSLSPLDEKALELIINSYMEKIKPIDLSDEAKNHLIETSNGDGRYLINMLENIEQIPGTKISLKELANYLQKKPALSDKAGDYHYQLISVFHKAVRGSDPDAALYWLARMLDAGQDPLFIARRLIRISIEDIGLSDIEAQQIAINAYETYNRLGSPEGELALVTCSIYLALAPKSNAAYLAFQKAKDLCEKTNSYPVPSSMINPSTKLSKELGHGKGYIYDHEQKNAFSAQKFFPDALERLQLYFPNERGFERELKKRIAYFEQLRTNCSK